MLTGVALLFAAFVLVQFRYFFGGAQNIGLQGFTFAEYARRGYGELMAVAFLSLLLAPRVGCRDPPRIRYDSKASSRALAC